MHYLLGQLDIVPSFFRHTFNICYYRERERERERENIIIIYMTPEEDHRGWTVGNWNYLLVLFSLHWFEKRERGGGYCLQVYRQESIIQVSRAATWTVGMATDLWTIGAVHHDLCHLHQKFYPNSAHAAAPAKTWLQYLVIQLWKL